MDVDARGGKCDGDDGADSVDGDYVAVFVVWRDELVLSLRDVGCNFPAFMLYL